MKKILFVIFAALAFVACEKEEKSNTPYMVEINWDSNRYLANKVTHPNTEFPILSAANADKAIFTTNCDTYVSRIIYYGIEDEMIVKSFDNTESECDFEIGMVKRIDSNTFGIEVYPTDSYAAVSLVLMPFDSEIKSNAIHIFFEDFLKEEFKKIEESLNAK